MPGIANRLFLTPQTSRPTAAKPVVSSCSFAVKFCESLGLVQRAETRSLMMMLTAYFDESGTHSESPILAVGGLLAPQDAWVEFAGKWWRALQKYGLAQFHMVEFENRVGAYKGLSNAERTELISRLTDIIAETAFVSVAAALVKADYATLCQTENVTFGSQYSFCANVCIRLLKDWMDAHGARRRIVYVFEHGAHGASGLREAFEAAYDIDPDRYHLQGLHFLSKADSPQLQAADIFAYETPKQALRTLGQESRPLRKSLGNILRGVPTESNLLDHESLPPYLAEARKWKSKGSVLGQKRAKL